MNIRLESINFLKKLYTGEKHNYIVSELKQISMWLAGVISKNDKLKLRVKELLLTIKNQEEKIEVQKKEINHLKEIRKNEKKEPKCASYNYIEMSVINEALELLIGECNETLKDKSCIAEPYINRITLARKIIDKNNEKIKDLKSKF